MLVSAPPESFEFTQAIAQIAVARFVWPARPQLPPPPQQFSAANKHRALSLLNDQEIRILTRFTIDRADAQAIADEERIDRCVMQRMIERCLRDLEREGFYIHRPANPAAATRTFYVPPEALDWSRHRSRLELME